MTRLRAVVLGMNHYHVTGWLGSLRALGDTLDVVATYDPDPSREGSAGPDFSDPALPASFPEWVREIPFESDLDRVIARHAPDIALITLPNADAAPTIARVARSGIHILSDKPGGRTSQEVSTSFAAARQSGVKSAVALTRRYGRGWQDARAMVESGALGRLLSTESVFVTSSVAVRGPSNLIFNRERMGGGVLHWLGIHELDALMWLAGESIANVLSRIATVGEDGIDVEDVVTASIEYASGAVGTVHMAYALPRAGADGYIALRGTNGSLRITPDGSWTFMAAGSVGDPLASQTSRYEFGPSTGYGSIGAVIVQDLLRAVRDDREPLVGGAAAANALAVVEAMYESSVRGQQVEVTYPT